MRIKHRFCDLRRLSSDWRSWYSIRFRLFSLFIFRDQNVQEIWSFTVNVKDSLQWCFQFVETEDSWVCATQNCIRNASIRVSSTNIDAQLSKLKKVGEKKYVSETPISKRWRQTLENRKRSSVKTRKRLSEVTSTFGGGMCYQWQEKGQCSTRKPVQWSRTKTDVESRLTL